MDKTENTNKKIKKVDLKGEYDKPKELSPPPFLLKKINNPIWLSVSESAKICGVNTKTIRRALQSNAIKYKIIQNRYSIDFSSLIQHVLKHKKLQNKFNTQGLGQYTQEWTK